MVDSGLAPLVRQKLAGPTQAPGEGGLRWSSCTWGAEGSPTTSLCLLPSATASLHCLLTCPLSKTVLAALFLHERRQTGGHPNMSAARCLHPHAPCLGTVAVDYAPHPAPSPADMVYPHGRSRPVRLCTHTCARTLRAHTPTPPPTITCPRHTCLPYLHPTPPPHPLLDEKTLQHSTTYMTRLRTFVHEMGVISELLETRRLLRMVGRLYQPGLPVPSCYTKHATMPTYCLLRHFRWNQTV